MAKTRNGDDLASTLLDRGRTFYRATLLAKVSMKKAGQEAARREASPASAPCSTALSCCHEVLTIAFLRLRNEIWRGGGMSRETFTRDYLDGLGNYEKALAAREGIPLEP